jgi:pimeloyl-ACP methyl ester carboxylesterase
VPAGPRRDVISAATDLSDINPCGDLESAPQAVTSDQSHIGSIHVPVLLVVGENDAVFTTEGMQRRKTMFSGSSDVKLIFLPNTGHALTLEKSAPVFAADVGQWLAARGL